MHGFGAVLVVRASLAGAGNHTEGAGGTGNSWVVSDWASEKVGNSMQAKTATGKQNDFMARSLRFFGMSWDLRACRLPIRGRDACWMATEPMKVKGLWKRIGRVSTACLPSSAKCPLNAPPAASSRQLQFDRLRGPA